MILDWPIANQVNSIVPNLLFAAMYLAAYFTFSKTKDTSRLFAASLACQIYGLSPLYNLTLSYDPPLVFLVYASIYITVIRYLSNYKTMIACFIMASFECVMYKAYLNELGSRSLASWMYVNYESIVAFLHLVIIFSVVKWSIFRSYCRNVFDLLSGFVVRYRNFLHFGG
jgi:hypothetical protein